ncbi:MAG TPA: MMPL family transporter, partial [Myxococcota bacterium]|nr:MMPL family transporter [Myxococcota bacterium]
MSATSDAAAPSPRLRRYAAWVVQQHRLVLLASILGALGAGVIAARLPVYADFSYLLPPSAESVRHLRALEKRARVLGTLMVAVKSDDPTERAAAAHAVRDGITALGPEVARSLTFDEHVGRQFAWNNRWLFASTEDLRAVRDALKGKVHGATLEANPLYVDFEDPPSRESQDEALARLRARLREAEAKKDDVGELVSKDGKLQMMIVRTAFASDDSAQSGDLLEAVRGVVAQVRQAHPRAEVGLAGDILSSDEEHRSILNGMLVAIIATVILCVGALLLYYRSIAAVGALSWALAVGNLLTFMFTRLAIGHLNVATAFLSSIVMGNGINFGIMLMARHIEERRAGKPGAEALTVAIAGTLRGTLAASLIAAVACLSLVV